MRLHGLNFNGLRLEGSAEPGKTSVRCKEAAQRLSIGAPAAHDKAVVLKVYGLYSNRGQAFRDVELRAEADSLRLLTKIRLGRGLYIRVRGLPEMAPARKSCEAARRRLYTIRDVIGR